MGGYTVPIGRRQLRDIIIAGWPDEYDAYEALRLLYNCGYRGRELDLRWKGKLR